MSPPADVASQELVLSHNRWGAASESKSTFIGSKRQRAGVLSFIALIALAL
jgi:hypothetical protein